MFYKVCSRCKFEKPVKAFYKTKRAKDGLQPACKNCMSISYNQSRKKDQARYQEVARVRNNKNTEQIREWKSQRGCKVCGETYAMCLELHHLDPDEKEFNPSEGSAKSWDNFLKEAAKCVVLCANCHRKVHGGIIDINSIIGV